VGRIRDFHIKEICASVVIVCYVPWLARVVRGKLDQATLASRCLGWLALPGRRRTRRPACGPILHRSLR